MTSHEQKLDQLMRSVQAGRIVHALLFVGPEGTGKKTAARRLAQSIYCTGGLRPCGECPACKRVAAGSHPDLHFLEPEKKLIRVDAVRDLLERLSLHPYEGQKHIAVITSAECMNPQAQNALLKTLEEPRDEVLFILTASGTSRLLPTILSRVQQLRFSALPPNECAAVLQRRGMPPEQARQLAGLAQGSVGQALAMAEDERRLKLRANTLSALEASLDRRPIAECVHILGAQKGEEALVLDILQLWARDLMSLQNGGMLFEESDLARLQRFRMSGTQLLKRVIEARRQLAVNVSWSNVLCELLRRP